MGLLIKLCIFAGYALALAACGINTIPTQEEKVNSAWAMVEVRLWFEDKEVAKVKGTSTTRRFRDAHAE